MSLVNNEEEIIDLQLDGVKKKKFRINGDSTKILELNTSDVGIVSRLSKLYPELQKLAEESMTFSQEELEDNSEEGLHKFADKLDVIDSKMSKLIDELFNANVSETCKDGGSMYDLFDGMFRFEHIINTLSNLYEQSFESDFSKMRQRIDKHTGKYISQRIDKHTEKYIK